MGSSKKHIKWKKGKNQGATPTIQHILQPQQLNINKRSYNDQLLGKAAKDSSDDELRKHAIDIAAKVKDDKMSIKAVVGVRQQKNKKGNSWCANVTNKQVGSYTPVLANAIYRRFLAEKAVQNDKEFITNTITNATTIDTATVTVTTGEAKKVKQSGQKRSSDQIS